MAKSIGKRLSSALAWGLIIKKGTNEFVFNTTVKKKTRHSLAGRIRIMAVGS
jgi:hypothetical protein